jgi:stearoyl-CoA desaturase (delta-9 desaturase)
MSMREPSDDPAPAAPQQASLQSLRIKWRYASPIIVIHLIAISAFLPSFFSWTGVVLAVLGCYVFGTLGMNIGYHRLVAHRSFACPLWLEYVLVILGACCLEESPIVWAALHRQHHHMADKEGDPHSPVASFLWGHLGWLLIKSDNAEAGRSIVRYAPDLTSDRFYSWLEVGDNWIKVALLSLAPFFVAGFVAVTIEGGPLPEAVRFGCSLLLWGGAVRIVAVWHLTWSVNSITHLWGYRNYMTPDNSRNNLLVSLITNGEGWHNNHHADPASARHGHGWREPDVAWLTIHALQSVGLVWDVALPSPGLAEALEARALRGAAGGAHQN